MLSHPDFYHHPFDFFLLDSAFSPEQCAVLEKTFLQAENWQHRDGSFYQCSLREVTHEIPQSFLDELTSRMREITRLPLVKRCVVTAQRMLPGQTVGLHSDRPLLGYEIARLVVQFNRHWQAEHGGILELFDSPDAAAIFQVNPVYNTAFGFRLHANSYHGVTKVSHIRQTLVFNFWHAANTCELETHLKALFEKADFTELPAELDAVAMEAESNFTEEETFLASTTALALHRWGYDATTVINGYCYTIGNFSIDSVTTEMQASILLADWIAHLYRNQFELEKWEKLYNKLNGTEVYSRLKTAWELCFPD